MRKKFFLTLIIVLAVAIISGGFWTWKNQRKAKDAQQQTGQNSQNKNNQNNDKSKKVDVSDWKTYRDEKYGFEIKYNPTWKIKEARNDEKGKDGLFILAGNNYGVNVGAEETLTQESSKAWFSRKSSTMKAKKENERDYLINNNSAYYSKMSFDNSYNEHEYVISNGKSLINFYFSEAVKQETENEEMKNIGISSYLLDFETMINSITFFRYDQNDSSFTYFKIPELGIKFKTSREFADSFSYSFESATNEKTGDKILIAYFPCGSIIKSNRSSLGYDSNHYEGSEFSRKIGTYYIIFQPHHAYDLQRDSCYDMKVRISFEDLLNNLEPTN
jgi:hypothetical protein